MRPLRLFLLIALAGLVLAGCGSTPSSSDGSTGGSAKDPAAASEEADDASATEPSIAEKLAVIQTRGPVGPDDAIVRKLRKALVALDRKCKEPRIRVSDMAVRSRQLLADEGIDESILSILRNVNTSIPDALGVTKCRDIFAAYVTLRIGG